MITHKYGSISCYDRTLEMECLPNINNNKNNLFVCLEEEEVSFKFLGGVGGCFNPIEPTWIEETNQMPNSGNADEKTCKL